MSGFMAVGYLGLFVVGGIIAYKNRDPKPASEPAATFAGVLMPPATFAGGLTPAFADDDWLTDDELLTEIVATEVDAFIQDVLGS